GQEITKLENEIKNVTSKEVKINVHEIKKPELSAQLVAENISAQIANRVSFRRAMKQSITASMRMGADGIKIMCAGRLGGAEIARTEQYKDGRIPLQTLRADIDYASVTSHTIYGAIGIKVWICRGEKLLKNNY
ncbi:MAG TPA: 30S ribosomal protein S3, partial [Ignavibacteria bacterium]